MSNEMQNTFSISDFYNPSKFRHHNAGRQVLKNKPLGQGEATALVEPIDDVMLGNYSYNLRMFPEITNRENARNLAIVLLEEDIATKCINRILLTLPFTTRHDSEWIQTATGLLGFSYMSQSEVLNPEMPDAKVIKGLLVGRAEHYRNSYIPNTRAYSLQ